LEKYLDFMVQCRIKIATTSAAVAISLVNESRSKMANANAPAAVAFITIALRVHNEVIRAALESAGTRSCRSFQEVFELDACGQNQIFPVTF
jgi:hypothetical protein